MPISCDVCVPSGGVGLGHRSGGGGGAGVTLQPWACVQGMKTGMHQFAGAFSCNDSSSNIADDPTTELANKMLAAGCWLPQALQKGSARHCTASLKRLPAGLT